MAREPSPPGAKSQPTRLAGVDEVATGGYLSAMRSVGIKTLKNKLSEYVRIAASGETVLVTDRDRVVAELVPPSPGRAESVSDAVIVDAIQRGWMTPRLYGPESVPERKPVAPLEQILEGLASDREDR
jgi:prevent-host-death family protein